MNKKKTTLQIMSGSKSEIIFLVPGSMKTVGADHS